MTNDYLDEAIDSIDQMGHMVRGMEGKRLRYEA